MKNKLSYEEWYNLNIEEFSIRWAESGRDRELDFDEEKELEILYENYINDETSLLN